MRSLRPLRGRDTVAVGGRNPERRPPLILATAKVEDVDRFLATFTTKGAEKRKHYGCGGSHVFRDPNDATRVLVVFDWDDEGYDKLLSDPDMPAIFQEAGLQGRPEHAELVREHEV
jgi:quinol monooxygenase YgiN